MGVPAGVEVIGVGEATLIERVRLAEHARRIEGSWMAGQVRVAVKTWQHPAARAGEPSGTSLQPGSRGTKNPHPSLPGSLRTKNPHPSCHAVARGAKEDVGNSKLELHNIGYRGSSPWYDIPVPAELRRIG